MVLPSCLCLVDRPLGLTGEDNGPNDPRVTAGHVHDPCRPAHRKWRRDAGGRSVGPGCRVPRCRGGSDGSL